MINLLLSVVMAATSSPQNYVSLKKTAFSETHEMKERWQSVVAMSKIEHRDRQKDLTKGLRDPAWFMRNVSLLALDSIDSKQALREAIKLLNDPSLVVRSAAVEVIAKSIQTSVVARESLWRELQDRDNKAKGRSLWIRSQIFQHLAASAKPQERPRFLKFTEDSDSEIQSLARATVAKIQ